MRARSVLDLFPRPRAGLTLKLLVPVLGAWLISAMALFSIFSRQAATQGYDDLTSRLESRASDKAAELSQPLWEIQTDTVLRLMRSYAGDSDMLYATLTDHTGALVSHVKGNDADPTAQAFTTYRPIFRESGGERYQLGTLELAYHDGRLKKLLAERSERDALIVGLVMAVLTLAIWSGMHAMVGKPLCRLEESLRRNAATGMRREKLQWSSGDELGKVVGAYNGLLEEVERQTDALKEEVARRAAAEAELRLAAKVFEVSIEAIAITNPQGVIQSVNASFERITGYTPEEAVGMHTRTLKSGVHPPSFYEEFWEALHTDGSWFGEVWNRRRNGDIHPVWLGISAVRDESRAVEHYVSVFHDITDYKKQQKAIEFQAFHDTLTGLPNRGNLDGRLNAALSAARRQGKKLALLFLDMDNFKSINDSLGHDVGDQLLQKLAERIQSVLRAEDCLARLGGDEFIALLTDVEGPGDAVHVARRISEALARPLDLRGFDLRTTASIGIALYPQDGTEPVELVKNADLAMYRAKDSGGDTWRFFTQDMDAKAKRRLSLEAGLHKALEDDEFELHYQPVCAVATGEPIGAEALLRWRAGADMIHPGEFIPVAEANGAIVPIGEWVLVQACRQAAQLAGQFGGRFTMSVNVSPRQFRSQGFLHAVEGALAACSAPAGSLVLEITESALMQDLDAAKQRLAELSGLGVPVWLDDFGTGYSSLAHLKVLPIDGLKIDRSFVSSLETCERCRALCASVVHLARDIGADVVAEGVETPQQLQYLKGIGCQWFQGYLVSRPVRPEQLLTVLTERRRHRGPAPVSAGKNGASAA